MRSWIILKYCFKKGIKTDGLLMTDLYAYVSSDLLNCDY